MPDLFIVARILRPHGLRGDLVVRSLTDHPETIMNAEFVYLGLDSKNPVKVQKARLHKGNPLLKLEGTDDMDSALALKGVEICVPREELVPLEEDEVFLHDLLGLTVLDFDGNNVGTVDGIVDTAGPPLLSVKRDEGKDVLVPFASGTIEEVELDGGFIRLTDLPGLVEE